MLDRFFALKASHTTVRQEIVAGATTFLTMAYIMFVNPTVLGAAGLDPGAVFVATCIASALTSILMGLYANLPVALAPGMGLNAYFAFTVVPALGGNWRLALGCVFLSGIAFVALSVSPAREWLINAIPKSLKLAIAAGIGLFLAFIGLIHAGIVTSDPVTLVRDGALDSPKVWISAAAFALIIGLAARGIMGAVLVGVLAATLTAILAGLQAVPDIVGLPPSVAPTFLQLSFKGASAASLASIIFVFLLVEVLDTSGTLTAVAHQGKLLDAKGHLPMARRALASDAIGTMIGAAVGTSPVTAYIESAAGIQAGGRTGLTAIVVGALFLISLFFSPLASAVPDYATAPALVFVAALMAKGLKDVDWDDLTEAAPALVTTIAIPCTFSIAAGIGLGFISYVAIKLAAGRYRDVHAAVAVIAAAFIVKIIIS